MGEMQGVDSSSWLKILREASEAICFSVAEVQLRGAGLETLD